MTTTDASRTDSVRLSEPRVRDVVEHVREVFFETDTLGRWTYLNPAWTVVTGFAVEESLGRAFSEFVWADDVDLSVARFNPLIAREREYSRHEIRYRTRNGGFRWIEVHVQAVLGDGGRIAGTSGTLRDVTAQRDLSEQLVRARETAIIASRAKSEFLANMSHEIRTPVNGVIGFTDLLLDTTLNVEQREYAEGVKQSAEALLTIINDILDFSKIEAGKLLIAPVRHDVHRVIKEAVNLVDVKARNKGLRVALDIDAGVPAEVVGDPVRVRQVLINLIDNAVKFTYTGHVGLSVQPVPRTDGELVVRFAVTDSGIGIEPGKLESIFEKFTQADASTTRRFGGSGLGLAICRQLVELMGGEIGVESEPGQGSTFWFHLPLIRIDATSPLAPAAEPEAPATERHATAPNHVLVVEDNAINLKVACRTLQKLGCEVDIAVNGAVAVDMVRNKVYDIVFMDCQMPVLDGYEATAAIRRLPLRERTRIVAMTAHALPADRDRCLAAGMDDYISKPINVDEIRRVLRGIDVDPEGSMRTPNSDGPGEMNKPSFDRDEFSARMDADLEAMHDLVELLSADGPSYLRALRTSIAAEDLETVADVAHTIKGSVSHFAATGAFELAKQLEAAARHRAIGDARDLARRLESEATRLIGDLREWVATLQAPASHLD